MAKKILCVVIILFTAVCVFAQDGRNGKNNISLSAGIFGAEAAYEYSLNRFLSLIGDVSYSWLGIADEFTVSAKGRIYPFGGVYFLELGLGFAYGHSITDRIGDILLGALTLGWYFTQVPENRFDPNGGFLVQPGMGWKVPLGNSALTMPISMGLDFKLVKINEDGKLPDAFPWLRVGLGYTF